MKIEIQKGIHKYDICLDSITQVCGQNIKLKEFIKKSLEKYFSNSKYMDYEKEMMNNVMLNGNKVGREYFKVYSIETIEDILKFIKIQKNSLLVELIEMELHDYDCQIQMEELKNILEEILKEIDYRIIGEKGSICLNYEMKSIFDLLKNAYVSGVDNECLENCDNFELLNTLINLLYQVQKNNPQKMLIMINNVDHLLNKKEYKQFIDEISLLVCKSDSYVVLFTSLEGYVAIDENLIEGINIVNQDIYSLPRHEKLIDFIEFNYPINLSKEECRKSVMLMEKIIHKIGDEDYRKNLKSELLLKIVNESMGIKEKNKKQLNNIELNFLNQ